MKNQILRRTSLIILGAMALAFAPASAAFAASVDSVTPAIQPRGASAHVSIGTSGFFLLLGAPTVDFGPGIAVTNPAASGSTVTADITIQSNAPYGFHVVTITDSLGTSAQCSSCFKVASPPTVSAMSPPTLGANASTKNFTITGTGFFPGASVGISGGGITIANVVVPSLNSTTLTVDLTPTAAVAGPRTVTVTNPGGDHGACSICFSVAAPPRATGLFPAQRSRGLTNQVITIIGSGFADKMDVAISGTGITLGTLQFIDSTTVKLPIDTAANAPLGARDVTFTNPDGGHSTCTGCFSIVGPTTVSSITVPNSVIGSIVATFSQPVGGVSSKNSFVKLTGTSTTFATTVSCLNEINVLTDCNSGHVMKALLKPVSPFVAGEHYTVSIAAAGTPAVIDFGGTAVPADTLDFRGGQNSVGDVVQEGEGAAAVSTWRIFSNSHAMGGTYTADHLAGATARYGFSGSYITWYTIVGPNYGIADLYIDGVAKASVNCYRPATAYGAAFTVSGLSASPHVLTIRVRGVKGSSSGTGTYIALDALRTNGVTVSSPHATYTWGVVSSSSSSGGSYIRSDLAGEYTQFRFRGTQLEWDTILGPGMGLAKVYIDGVLKGTVDNYSATATYKFARIYGGLTDSVHTFKVVVLGTHRAASNGAMIAIDRWIVS